jgi:hypothetical protein
LLADVPRSFALFVDATSKKAILAAGQRHSLPFGTGIGTVV